MAKKALVTGAGGFIGTHLVRYLKEKGYWVKGADLKNPSWSKSAADNFYLCDLREKEHCLKACYGVDEVYDLAADMGGMGFITGNSASNLYNNTLINTYMIEAARIRKVKRYFFSSSVCVYPVDRLSIADPKPMNEEDAFPANPQKGYGWQKLTHEMRCLYYGKEMGLETRIARFQNTYGPEGTYDGGREKAPAALCRKTIMAKEGGEIEVWGDGNATREFTYISDLVDGIYKLMQSDSKGPVILGTEEQISINDFADLIIGISGKDLGIKNVEGPEGVKGRNFSHEKAKKYMDWEAKVPLKEGITNTYRWIKKQMLPLTRKELGK